MVQMLQVAQIVEKTRALGPGVRFGIWVQGCSILCPGCINQSFLPFGGGKEMSVDELFERIDQTEGIEGVSFSGGEPFDQAEGVLALARRIKEETPLTLLSYSGYTYEYLISQGTKAQRELLNYLDILIDGPYEMKQKKHLLWRGSQNQKVRFLSPRYQHLAPFVEQETILLDFQFDENGNLILIGNFSQNTLTRLKKEMAKRGIHIQFSSNKKTKKDEK